MLKKLLRPRNHCKNDPALQKATSLGLNKAATAGWIGLLVLSMLFLTGFSPAQQTTPTPPTATGAPGAHITQVDTSQFPKVTVYVSVTDSNGEPVGVSPSQLALQENGVPVKPDDIGGSGDIGPLATLLVMDISGSMNSSGKLQAAQDAARAYINQARPQDQIGLLSFNTKVEYVQPLTKNRQAMVDAIDALQAQGDTAMYDALKQAMDILGSVSGRKAIIVLTDGLDNRSKHTSQEIIGTIGPAGLSISTVGLGDPKQSKSALSSLNEPALKTLAEQAGGGYGFAKDASSLRSLYERLGRALQSEYRFTYTTPSKLRDGVNRSLSVSLQNSKATSGLAAGAPVQYNPGGLVPEVATPASWGLFLALLAGLTLLLFVPLLVGRAINYIQARNKGKPASSKKTARIKIKS